MREHKFGSADTGKKLDAIEHYLVQYTSALSQMSFDLWYVDAFAGNGNRTINIVEGGLFEGQPLAWETKTVAGSARRALGVNPPFHHFVFIEKNKARCAALQDLAGEFPSADISIRQGDANAELVKFLNEGPWLRTHSRRSRVQRGIVFLDPYALQVEWKTLQLLASTEIVDVWYLFPIRDVGRQLSHDIAGVGPKAQTMDVVLGPEWRELYQEPQPGSFTQLSLLEEASPAGIRVEKQRQIEDWFRNRLAQHFYVEGPLALYTEKNVQNFSLFLCVSNPSEAARKLAKEFYGRVSRKVEKKASRRKSSR